MMTTWGRAPAMPRRWPLRGRLASFTELTSIPFVLSLRIRIWAPGSPAPGILHARPRLLRRQVPVLQQFNRDSVGRLDEGHVPVARGAINRDAGVHQPLAGLVDVLYAVGEVAEIAPAGVLLRCAAVFGRPIPGQLD